MNSGVIQIGCCLRVFIYQKQIPSCLQSSPFGISMETLFLYHPESPDQHFPIVCRSLNVSVKYM